MTFHKRTLSGPATLGQRLRQLREERGLSLEQLAHDIKVAPKYVEAIEEGRYHELPGRVYAQNFVRQYVDFVELDQEAAVQRFNEEFELMSSVHPSSRPLMAQRAKTEGAWWRRNLRGLIAGLTIAFVLGYFGWQVFRLFSPPTLAVTAPSIDITTTERTLTVRGATEPSSSVTINRQEVEVADDGTFVEMIDLQIGLNTLRIAASKQRSGEQVIIRQVLVEPERLPSE